jgi:hypothetical protein
LHWATGEAAVDAPQESQNNQAEQLPKLEVNKVHATILAGNTTCQQ